MKHPNSPDELQPLTEAELGDLLELAHPRLDAFAKGAPRKAQLVRRLVAEVRRLRQLVADAGPHIPDNGATRAIGLPARLRAEADRG